MAERIDGIALGSIAVGAALAYAGIKGKSIPSLIQGFVQGKSPAAATPANVIASTTGPATGTTTPNNAGAAPAGTPAADLTGSDKANRALGRLMAAAYGWGTGTNWQALDYGWGTLESGWSNTAQNGVWPDAYGIAQANPGTKYPKSGWPAGQGGSSDPATQIAWGLSYIKSTYGAPENVPGWLGGSYSGY